MTNKKKELKFVGSTQKALQAFPVIARGIAGVQIENLLYGGVPADWKPMKTVGQGVREIRIRDDGNAYRVFYVVVTNDAVYLLHAFQKTTEETEKKDIDKGKTNYKEVMRQK